MRVRGLKHVLFSLYSMLAARSHPMRVRGLKQYMKAVALYLLVSHPMRVRGLKHYNSTAGQYQLVVAPHAGAWIET